MFDNSDEYDFNPSHSSKLASLFNNTTLSDDINSSLTYTAPKQPKSKKERDSQESNKSKVPSSVLIAKIISLWKLEDKDYKSLGKHCVALIGSSDLNLYEVIAYKEKHKVLLRQKVHNDWNFYNQRDSFSSFYDNENQNWLLKFENITDQNTFCTEIKNCGANIICSQEPSPQKVEENAFVEPKDICKDGPSPNPEMLQNHAPTAERNHEEVDSDSSSSQKRANILSRMAKMGQQILPKQILKNTSTDLSDSELDDTKDIHKTLPRKIKRTVHSEKPTVVPKEDKKPQLPQYNYLESQMVPSNSNISMQLPQNISTPVVYNQPIPYDSYNHYVIAQNTELKMNLAHISTKLDMLLNGKDINYNSSDNVLKSKIKVLELRSENLIAEIDMYKEQCYNLQMKYEELKEKNLDRSKNDESKTVIENLNKEIEKLNLQITAAEEKIINYQDLEDKFKNCQTEIDVHKETIETQRVKLKEFEILYEENKSLQLTVDYLNNTVSNLKEKLNEFEESFQKVESEKQKYFEENNKNSEMFGDKIKEHMNIMYQSIISSFNETETYSVSDINPKIVKNLKETTFRILEDFKQLYKTESATGLKD